MSIAVRLNGVSKKFNLHHERPRSFQELFLSWGRYRQTHPKSFWVLRDVSFDVAVGESVGIIGPNGAGKSTVLKLVSRILVPTEGCITVNGRVAALLELGAGFHPELTGRENVYLNGSVLGLSRRQIDGLIPDIVDFAELGHFFDTPVKHYSSGMYMRLGFSVAVHVDPDILLIDEVLAVGDEAFQRKCLDKVEEIKERGKTLLFVSHGLSAVANYCDRVVWLDGGEVRMDDIPQQVISDYLEFVSHSQTCDLGSIPLSAPVVGSTAQPKRQRWGSGEIQIDRVALVLPDGRERWTCSTGDRLTVRMEYVTTEAVEQPVFGVGIRRSDGVHVAGPNSQMAHYDFPLLKGSGVVECQLPELPLLAGEYQLSVAVYDHSLTHAFDHHDWLHQFIVIEREEKPGLGLLHLPCEWRERRN